MTNDEVRALALSIVQSDTEEAVVETLKEAGFWDDPAVWRAYGDSEGNFSTIGNQQSRPEAALVEKLVNAVDARLMNECLVRGIDPAGRDAPDSLRHAVASFFEGKDQPIGDIGGTLQGWDPQKHLEQSRFITLAVTGHKPADGNPCLTIADLGEGQSPTRVPDTFVSIDRKNKLRIPFVQGKFNMGGTGALKFCGKHSIQVIITRRNPRIVAAMSETDHGVQEWSFTVVRRDRPKRGTGEVRNSVFRFLAPVDATNAPGMGSVLSFRADHLPLMPENNQPYVRPMKWGSVLKLFEYDMKGFRTHALRGRNSLILRLELLLPQIGLPIRVHECRDYGGREEASFANSIVGLSTRLAENRSGNIEDGYPASAPLTVHGESMVAQIYAFKEGKADTYRTNEGIIFTINGQTHGFIPKTFFERKRVRMGRLSRSLIVMVDCSMLSVGAREDLFMNSRDRLSNGELRKAIEDQLQDVIGTHPGLKELRESRKRQEIEDRLKDSRPLEDVLGSVLKSSPSLAQLFLRGQRLSQPHRAGAADGRGGGGHGQMSGAGDFVGSKHPTFFRFHKKKDGESLRRQCEIGRKCRIKFDTDVENEYFVRTEVPGKYYVEVAEGALEGEEVDHNLTLYGGIANWSVTLPEDKLTPGDQLTLLCTIADDTLVEPIVNTARLTVTRPTARPAGGGGRKEGRPGGGNAGNGGSGEAGDGEGDSSNPPDPAGIELPRIIKVRQDDPKWREHNFDERTACKVVEDTASDGSNRSEYTFYVNVDNRFLRTDMKAGSGDSALLESKFVFGNVLVGLALIHDYQLRSSKRDGNGHDDSEATVSTIVHRTTRAVAPFLVPMIDYLGALTPEEVAELAEVGDDE